MKYSQIEVGNKVKFSLKKSKVGDKKVYDSTVVEVYEHEKVFTINTLDFQFTTSEKGDLYEFVIFTKQENVSCDCTIIRSYASHGNYFTTLRVVSPVIKAQLRTYPRYQLNIPVKYNVFDEGYSLLDEPTHTIDGIVQDISGGGARIYGSVALEENTRVRVMIEKQDGSMLADGVVVKQMQIPDSGDGFIYEMRIRFLKTIGSRRKKPRVIRRLPLRFSILAVGDDPYTAEYRRRRVFVPGEAKNINENGIGLMTNKKLEAGTKLYLEIEDEDEVLIAEGVVVSNLPHSLGNKGYLYENGISFITSKKRIGMKLSDMVNQ